MKLLLFLANRKDPQTLKKNILNDVTEDVINDKETIFYNS